MIRRLIRHAGLPLLFVLPLAVYAFGAGRAIGEAEAWVLGVGLATYAVIQVFERLLPARPAWQPAWGEIGVDLQFLAVGTVAIELFTAAVMLSVLRLTGTEAPLAGWWPRDLPIWAQGVLVVVIADGLRYWQHRALHEVPLLWRLHAPHHAVEKLYAVNAVRFHPLEFVFQAAFYTLPFALLGVDPWAVGYWLVIHLAFGFIQHCNVDFREAGLGRLFTTPDVHRWHHAADPPSPCNFAFLLPVWDMLFGTYHLPAGSRVETLGLRDVRYPKKFLAQLRASFMKSDAAGPTA